MNNLPGEMAAATPDVSPKRQDRVLVALLALCLAAVCAWTAVRSETLVWASPLVPIEYEQPAYLGAIRTAVASGRGGPIDLLSLRTPDGSSTTISAIVGHFESTDIEPHDTWVNASLSNAMLVNSVDEHESNSGGMSGAISDGCGFTDQRASLGPGLVHRHVCAGKYLQFGIHQIANIATVTYTDVNAGAPCYNPNASDETLKLCVKGVIHKGLQHLFKSLSKDSQAERPDAVIIPQLGTGHGGLDKATFYESLTQSIEWLLEESGPHPHLPRRILLQAQLDSDGTLHSGDEALAAQLLELQTHWNSPSHHTKVDSTGLWVAVGVLAGVAVMSLLGRVPTAVGAGAPIGQRFLFALGWSMAAYGSATGILKLVDAASDVAPWVMTPLAIAATGSLCVLLSGYLLAAGNRYKDSASASAP